jgi:hypothetical protein
MDDLVVVIQLQRRTHLGAHTSTINLLVVKVLTEIFKSFASAMLPQRPCTIIVIVGDDVTIRLTAILSEPHWPITTDNIIILGLQVMNEIIKLSHWVRHTQCPATIAAVVCIHLSIGPTAILSKTHQLVSTWWWRCPETWLYAFDVCGVRRAFFIGLFHWIDALRSLVRIIVNTSKR